MFAYRWLLQFERIELIHGIGSCFFIKMCEVESGVKICYAIIQRKWQFDYGYGRRKVLCNHLESTYKI